MDSLFYFIIKLKNLVKLLILLQKSNKITYFAILMYNININKLLEKRIS